MITKWTSVELNKEVATSGSRSKQAYDEIFRRRFDYAKTVKGAMGRILQAELKREYGLGRPRSQQVLETDFETEIAFQQEAGGIEDETRGLGPQGYKEELWEPAKETRSADVDETGLIYEGWIDEYGDFDQVGGEVEAGEGVVDLLDDSEYIDEFGDVGMAGTPYIEEQGVVDPVLEGQFSSSSALRPETQAFIGDMFGDYIEKMEGVQSQQKLLTEGDPELEAQIIRRMDVRDPDWRRKMRVAIRRDRAFQTRELKPYWEEAVSFQKFGWEEHARELWYGGFFEEYFHHVEPVRLLAYELNRRDPETRLRRQEVRDYRAEGMTYADAELLASDPEPPSPKSSYQAELGVDRFFSGKELGSGLLTHQRVRELEGMGIEFRDLEVELAEIDPKMGAFLTKSRLWEIEDIVTSQRDIAPLEVRQAEAERLTARRPSALELFQERLFWKESGIDEKDKTGWEGWYWHRTGILPDEDIEATRWHQRDVEEGNLVLETLAGAKPMDPVEWRHLSRELRSRLSEKQERVAEVLAVHRRELAEADAEYRRRSQELAYETERLPLSADDRIDPVSELDRLRKERAKDIPGKYTKTELHSEDLELPELLDMETPRARYGGFGIGSQRTYGLELELLSDLTRSELERELEWSIAAGLVIEPDLSIRTTRDYASVIHELGGKYGDEERWIPARDFVREQDMFTGAQGTELFSIDDYEKIYGHELIFPVMQGQEGLDIIGETFDALSTIETELNTSMGLHVHVGAQDLSNYDLVGLWGAFAAREGAIDLMHEPSRRGLGSRYAKSLPAVRGDLSFDSRIERARKISLLSGESRSAFLDRVGYGRKYQKLNLRGFEHRTVEYRQPASTLDVGEVEGHIRFITDFVDEFAGKPLEWAAQRDPRLQEPYSGFELEFGIPSRPGQLLMPVEFHSADVTSDHVWRFLSSEDRQKVGLSRGAFGLLETQDAVDVLRGFYPEAETLEDVIERANLTEDVYFRAQGSDLDLMEHRSYDLALTKRYRKHQFLPWSLASSDARVDWRDGEAFVTHGGVFAAKEFAEAERYLGGLLATFGDSHFLEGGSQLHIFEGLELPRHQVLDIQESIVKPSTELYRVHESVFPTEGKKFFAGGEWWPEEQLTPGLVDAPAELFAVEPRRRYLQEERPFGSGSVKTLGGLLSDEMKKGELHSSDMFDEFGNPIDEVVEELPHDFWDAPVNKASQGSVMFEPVDIDFEFEAVGEGENFSLESFVLGALRFSHLERLTGRETSVPGLDRLRRTMYTTSGEMVDDFGSNLPVLADVDDVPVVAGDRDFLAHVPLDDVRVDLLGEDIGVFPSPRVTLTASQQAALGHTFGPAVVMAGPGSGKSRTLIERLRYLSEENLAAPEDVLTLVFGKKAQMDLLERASELGGDWNIRTLDAFALDVVRENFGALGYKGQPSITTVSFEDWLGDSEVQRTLQDLGSELDPRNRAMVRAWASQYEETRRGFVSGREDYSGLSESLQQAIHAFRKQKFERNELDFSDALSQAGYLLETNEGLRRRYREQFPFVQVDEFQDVSLTQARLLNQLSPNLWAVGDLDQSIMSFRGGAGEVMGGMIRRGASLYNIEENFRSTPEIVSAAQGFIGSNLGRMDISQKAVKPSGESVQMIDISSERQSESVLELAEQIREGERTAILTRTVRERDLLKSHIGGILKDRGWAVEDIEQVEFETLHASKGREFEHVILPINLLERNTEKGMVSDVTLPSRYARTAEELAEEERLFYVGMTRAEDRLTIMGDPLHPYFEKVQEAIDPEFSDKVSDFLGQVPTLGEVTEKVVDKIVDRDSGISDIGSDRELGSGVSVGEESSRIGRFWGGIVESIGEAVSNAANWRSGGVSESLRQAGRVEFERTRQERRRQWEERQKKTETDLHSIDVGRDATVREVFDALKFERDIFFRATHPDEEWWSHTSEMGYQYGTSELASVLGLYLGSGERAEGGRQLRVFRGESADLDFMLSSSQDERLFSPSELLYAFDIDDLMFGQGGIADTVRAADINLVGRDSRLGLSEDEWAKLVAQSDYGDEAAFFEGEYGLSTRSEFLGLHDVEELEELRYGLESVEKPFVGYREGADIPGLQRFLDVADKHPNIFYRFESDDPSYVSQDLAQTRAVFSEHEGKAKLLPDSFMVPGRGKYDTLIRPVGEDRWSLLDEQYERIDEGEKEGTWDLYRQEYDFDRDDWDFVYSGPVEVGYVGRRGLYGHVDRSSFIEATPEISGFRQSESPMQLSDTDRHLSIHFGTSTPFREYIGAMSPGEDVFLSHGVLARLPVNLDASGRMAQQRYAVDPNSGEFIEGGNLDFNWLADAIEQLPVGASQERIWGDYLSARTGLEIFGLEGAVRESREGLKEKYRRSKVEQHSLSPERFLDNVVSFRLYSMGGDGVEEGDEKGYRIGVFEFDVEGSPFPGFNPWLDPHPEGTVELTSGVGDRNVEGPAPEDRLLRSLLFKPQFGFDIQNLPKSVQDSVVRIDMSEAHGTGFFVAENIIATNYHVIDHAKIVDEVSGEALWYNPGFQIRVPGMDKPLSVESVLGFDQFNDIALLRVPDIEGKQALSLASDMPVNEWVDDPIQGEMPLPKLIRSLGYPKGIGTDPQFDVGSFVDVLGSDREMAHLSKIDFEFDYGSVYGGESGSPIFSDSGTEVFGILWGSRGGDAEGAGEIGVGTSSGDIQRLISAVEKSGRFSLPAENFTSFEDVVSIESPDRTLDEIRSGVSARGEVVTRSQKRGVDQDIEGGDLSGVGDVDLGEKVREYLRKLRESYDSRGYSQGDVSLERGFIYRLQNLQTEESYVGLSKNHPFASGGRIRKHLSGSGSSEISKALKDYDPSDFSAEVWEIDDVGYRELGHLEQQMIAFSDSLEGGYNLTLGGEIPDSVSFDADPDFYRSPSDISVDYKRYDFASIPLEVSSKVFGEDGYLTLDEEEQLFKFIEARLDVSKRESKGRPFIGRSVSVDFPEKLPLDSRLDINDSTSNLLSQVPGISTRMAEGIERWTSIFGPYQTFPEKLEHLEGYFKPVGAVGGGKPFDAIDVASLFRDASRLSLFDVDTATAADFESLYGVSEALAESIIADREARGDFGSISNLSRVRGVSARMVDSFRDQFLSELSHPDFGFSGLLPNVTSRYLGDSDIQSVLGPDGIEKLYDFNVANIESFARSERIRALGEVAIPVPLTSYHETWQPINVDTATWQEFEDLPGVGEALARRIVADREKFGDFGDFRGLSRVKGISGKGVEQWAEYFEGFQRLRDMGVSSFQDLPRSQTLLDFQVGAERPWDIDINQAGVEEWSRVPGVSTRVARLITAHRAGRGDFAGIEDLHQRVGLSSEAYSWLLPQQQVDLNRSSAMQLSFLPGIGDLAAQRIVDYRERHGGFADVQGLSAVQGITPDIIEGLEAFLPDATRLDFQRVLRPEMDIADDFFGMQSFSGIGRGRDVLERGQRFGGVLSEAQPFLYDVSHLEDLSLDSDVLSLDSNFEIMLRRYQKEHGRTYFPGDKARIREREARAAYPEQFRAYDFRSGELPLIDAFQYIGERELLDFPSQFASGVQQAGRINERVDDRLSELEKRQDEIRREIMADKTLTRDQRLDSLQNLDLRYMDRRDQLLDRQVSVGDVFRDTAQQAGESIVSQTIEYGLDKMVGKGFAKLAASKAGQIGAKSLSGLKFLSPAIAPVVLAAGTAYIGEKSLDAGYEEVIETQEERQESFYDNFGQGQQLTRERLMEMPEDFRIEEFLTDEVITYISRKLNLSNFRGITNRN